MMMSKKDSWYKYKIWDSSGQPLDKGCGDIEVLEKKLKELKRLKL